MDSIIHDIIYFVSFSVLHAVEGSKTSMSERENRNFIFDKQELSMSMSNISLPQIAISWFIKAWCPRAFNQPAERLASRLICTYAVFPLSQAP